MVVLEKRLLPDLEEPLIAMELSILYKKQKPKKEERKMPIIDSVVLHHCNLQGSCTNVAPIVKTFKARCHFLPNCLNSDGSIEEGAFTTF